jgi:hypothetical protein
MRKSSSVGKERDSSFMHLSPVLFVRKAEAKRLETGDNRYWAKLERQDVNLKQRAKKVLSQPFIVLFSEPMLIALTLYMSVSAIVEPFESCLKRRLVCLWMSLYSLHSIPYSFYPRPWL